MEVSRLRSIDHGMHEVVGATDFARVLRPISIAVRLSARPPLHSIDRHVQS
jgi:hypothetical protein